MNWARETHGIGRFVASVGPNNVASLGVLAKLGFVLTGSHMDDVGGFELVFELHAAKDPG